jgi:hypothetical protein
MTIDQEWPQRVRQTIKVIKPMMTTFFNPKQVIMLNLLP